MDFNSTVDLIIRDLNETREIIDDFKNYPGVPLLQVELAKSKCKSAAEVIAMLKNLPNSTQTANKKESIFKKPDEKKKPSKKIQEEPDTSSIFPPAEDITEQLHVKITETSIFADTFNYQADSLNDQLVNQRDDDGILNIFQNRPLTSLSDAIGVNDKFLFIREIFDGNPEAYNQAIAKLDETATLADAEAIIISYTGNNIETGAARQLLDMIKRKFPANE